MTMSLCAIPASGAAIVQMHDTRVNMITIEQRLSIVYVKSTDYLCSTATQLHIIRT